MREWSLGSGDPLSLTLRADMRLCTPDYVNDHIWELDLGGGEPPSLAVRTTYGLRARQMRLFYSFRESGAVVTDPSVFHQAPRLRRFHPNLLVLDLVPFEGLEGTTEYWIPESHVLAGRLTLVNRTAFPRHIDFELCGTLSPLDGKALGSTKQQMVNVLTARSSGLQPVVFMNGGPKHGPDPHPSLAVGLDFDAGQSRTIAWACAAETTVQDSFDLARRTVARPWDAECARIELLDAGDTLDIYTGDPDWDAALAFSQKAALGLFYPPSQNLPHPSFVRVREPDGGHSRSGDGTDYPPAWSGQSPLDSYYLASLLPAAGLLKRGLLENFLAAQSADGSVDGRPGLAGQRSKFLAAPILASLAWNIYQHLCDDEFLAQAYPKLLVFFRAWFLPYHDRDADGIPEWDHVLQTGFEDNPLFDAWSPWSQALTVSSLFNPELESLLYREATSLARMAEKLDRKLEIDELRQQATRLSSSIAAAWNPRRSLYAYRDRLTGASWTGTLLASRKGPGEILKKSVDLGEATRLLILTVTKDPAAKRPVIKITGVAGVPGAFDPQKAEAAQGERRATARKRSERIEEQQFQWRSGGLVATSQLTYSRLEHIKIEGLGDTDRILVHTMDTSSEDITLFAPLWANLPHPDHAQKMLGRLVQEGEGFNRPFGIPALPTSPAPARSAAKEAAEAEAVAMGVHLPWNQLVGEGMLLYGFRAEAAQLTTRLMDGVVRCLKQSRAFYERYHAETGRGLGERGDVSGLAPVGLFLQALGVQILSPARVRLEGKNPFPWPVTILHRGLKVVRGTEATEVTFANGQVVTVTDPAPCVVSR
jgi:hypothetical protein